MCKKAQRVSRLCLLICAAFCIGCSTHADATAQSGSPDFASASFDTLFIFARNWPGEDAELAVTRDVHGKSTVTLIREARDKRPRMLLDSTGTDQKEPPEVDAILKTFDLWAMNAPNAAGAACKTANGRRNCAISFKDYTVVMKIVRGTDVRVQRYTHLEANTANRSARALADQVLGWARKREKDRGRSQ